MIAIVIINIRTATSEYVELLVFHTATFKGCHATPRLASTPSSLLKDHSLEKVVDWHSKMRDRKKIIDFTLIRKSINDSVVPIWNLWNSLMWFCFFSLIAICSSFPVALKAYIALIYVACCSLPYVSFASLSSATTVRWQLVFWQTKFPIKKGAFLEKRLEH